MTLTYLPYDDDEVARLRAGEPDAYGNPAERAISSGVGTPCRSCLRNVPEGAEMLVCAARPFSDLQPYAETGPVFFCADECMPHAGDAVPAILETSPDYLVKAYDRTDRIIYGTGQITPKAEIAEYAARLFEKDEVAYVDVRSARNNCFLTRIVQTP
ncbi:DUF1203 domain-containing protein [Cognatiyoonia sp. IB215182]|uniref:DUF1203 domain-containing protein n=1 Tax=Cognatiyoonia sp. IB215182 TaxID=3097353 RepID=UPI002A12486D|nr:DUF1203 domain-containing protein [Cognatiyoonia sp. IB215182]MDX8353280.1 DUF1203 domain-containing protein [Cognatiyoonia sp. IB215182]